MRRVKGAPGTNLTSVQDLDALLRGAQAHEGAVRLCKGRLDRRLIANQRLIDTSTLQIERSSKARPIEHRNVKA